MSADWEVLRGHLAGYRVEQVEQFVTGLDPQSRAALSKHLTTYVRSGSPEFAWSSGRAENCRLPSVAVAAVGLLPSSAAVATMLGRADLRWDWHLLPVSRMVAVAAARGADWLPDLAARMATKLPRDPDDGAWRGVADLVAATGAPVPDGDTFLLGWAAWLREPTVFREWPPAEGERVTLTVRRLLDGPFLTALLPRVFEVNGLGLMLGTPEVAVAPSLVALVNAGRIDRAEVLDGCLARQYQPDRPGALRFFTGLHDLLAPTEKELAERAQDYADLAASAPSPVAAFALRHLRTLLDAGLLETDLLLGVAPTVLERPEKGNVRALITLLDRAVSESPGRAGDIVTVLAGCFSSPVYDVAEKALAVVLRRARRLSDADRETIADQVALLPADLREKAQAAGLGGPELAAVPAPQEAPLLPCVDEPEPWLTPIADLADLKTALEGKLGLSGWTGREHVMAAVVSLSADRPDEVRELQRVLWSLANGVHGFGGKHGYWAAGWNHGQAHFLEAEQWPYDPLMLSLSERVHRVEKFVTARDALLAGRPTPHLQTWSDYPHHVVLLRMAEAGLGLAGQLPDFDGPVPPLLLATPTDRSGRIQAQTLLSRLRRAESEGWQPWPLDLEQALLRLPRNTEPKVREAAADLTSAAGRRFAQWLGAGGLPAPVQRLRGGLRAREGTYRADEKRPGGVRVVDIEPGGEPRSGLHRGLFHIDHNEPPFTRHWMGSQPPADVFPDHREVISAWALTDIDPVREGQAIDCLPSGHDSGGPIGPATTLLIAYHLGSDSATGRTAGVDAVLGLAASGHLDGAVLGEHLGALIADGPIIGTRVYPELAEAARTGAGQEIWRVMTTMLPYVLDSRPAGVPDLLALATDLAARHSDGSSIPKLDEMADRTGSGKAVQQARRLRTAIRQRAGIG
ncbi:DUF6493 family protein [Kineosporia sp. NBRC 101731]|uniref:DUF6493 family protein n=1 Tax=Kineosporia sp. NBRC 101731 TaxID=3032199 RepID=UPI0024A1B12E|nr:DUF6493 family protein [Kineosporia sp. NBRC 101731]GLY31469.1 hypothetical protein Kisp02_48340 [Kineosporia sp. NBRC 101731]